MSALTMRPESRTYRFGPFHLDSGRRRLARGQDTVHLPDRSMDVLLILAASAGRIVSKEAITEAVWHDFPVTDNSLCQAISDLRQALGRQDNGKPYVDTVVRKGYRFGATIEEGAAGDVQALLEPYRAFVDGRAALETLGRDAVVRAHAGFREMLRLDPGCAAAHIGMANVCWLIYESTRMDIAPDRAALGLADYHAHEACRLDPRSGHAWSTLAIVHCANGVSREAIAAARKAVALQPFEWRHHLRLAHVSWGGERLEAACRVLSLCPGLALAHWYAATVFVARGALDAAIDHLRAGAAAQDAQHDHVAPFTAVGLHWLLGLVLAARGHIDEAREELARELAGDPSRHVYGRESAANSRYALGVLDMRQARFPEACAAFQQTLALVPGHALAIVGLAAAEQPLQSLDGLGPSSLVTRATVGAAVLVLKGDHAAAARLCGDALAQAPAGSDGWFLPVEPLLHAAADREAWAATLDRLRDRAV